MIIETKEPAKILVKGSTLVQGQVYKDRWNCIWLAANKDGSVGIVSLKDGSMCAGKFITDNQFEHIPNAKVVL